MRGEVATAAVVAAGLIVAYGLLRSRRRKLDDPSIRAQAHSHAHTHTHTHTHAHADSCSSDRCCDEDEGSGRCCHDHPCSSVGHHEHAADDTSSTAHGHSHHQDHPHTNVKAASAAPAPPSPSVKRSTATATAGKATRPPALGAIMQLSKETGAARAACKAALVASGNDYDAARAALMPKPPEPEVGPDDDDAPSASSDAFEPSRRFAGARPGWVFKRGPLGVGYYRDCGDSDGGGGGGGRRDPTAPRVMVNGREVAVLTDLAATASSVCPPTMAAGG